MYISVDVLTSYLLPIYNYQCLKKGSSIGIVDPQLDDPDSLFHVKNIQNRNRSIVTRLKKKKKKCHFILPIVASCSEQFKEGINDNNMYSGNVFQRNDNREFDESRSRIFYIVSIFLASIYFCKQVSIERY